MDCTEGAKTLTSCFAPTFFSGTPVIRTQTQMIRTQATGCFVPILFAAEIRLHQPKQRLKVSLAFSGGTLNSAEKKSRRWIELHDLVTFT